MRQWALPQPFAVIKLALNQMTVVEAVGTQLIDPSVDGRQLNATVSSLLDEGIAQNTTCSIFLSKDGILEVSGSPTEKAIRVLSWEFCLILSDQNPLFYTSPLFILLRSEGALQ